MSLLIFCVIAVCVVTRILIDLLVRQHRHWPGAQHPANQLDAASGARQLLVAVWNHYSRVCA